MNGTELTIRNPMLTGVYHWMTGDIRNVGLNRPLGAGMLQVWELMHADHAGECLQTLMPDGTIVSAIQ